MDRGSGDAILKLRRRPHAQCQSCESPSMGFWHPSQVLHFSRMLTARQILEVAEYSSQSLLRRVLFFSPLVVLRTPLAIPHCKGLRLVRMADRKGKGKEDAGAGYRAGEKRHAESSSASSASSRQHSPDRSPRPHYESGFLASRFKQQPVVAPPWSNEDLERYKPQDLSHLRPAAPSTVPIRSDSGGSSLPYMPGPPPAPQSGTGGLPTVTPNIPVSGPGSAGPPQPSALATSVGSLPATSPRPAPATAPQPRSAGTTGPGGSVSSSGPVGVSPAPRPVAQQYQPLAPIDPPPQPTPATATRAGPGGSMYFMDRDLGWGPYSTLGSHHPPTGGRHHGEFVANPNTMTSNNRPPPPNQGLGSGSGSHSQGTGRHRHQRRRTDEGGSGH
ncbi:hypothetical protein V8F20_011998 [Naviculisporaceae sp. PSN 640]